MKKPEGQTIHHRLTITRFMPRTMNQATRDTSKCSRVETCFSSSDFGWNKMRLHGPFSELRWTYLV